jgi:hypothetical protein
MNKAKLTISFLFSFLSLTLFSQSYLGGEIQVSQLQDGDFEFNVIYIQNCVSCSEGANCDLPNQLKLHYGNRSFAISLKQVDVENSSSGKCSNCTRCTNDTCALRYGYATYKLQATANLDSIISQNYCTIKAELKNGLIDQENSTISTVSSNFILLSTEFNACAVNSTPVSTYLGGPICLGRDAVVHSKSYDLGKNENDNLVYSFAPISGVNGNVDYLSSYNFDKPMYYLGFPKNGLKFPRGIHLDSLKGDLMFRPMKTENFTIRIKVEEYRNSQWLSTSYKDLHFEVIKCPNNTPPVISGINCAQPKPQNFKTSVVAGEKICFTICTSDKEKSDTVKIDWNKGIEGANFEILDSTSKRQNARFCWTPTDANINKFPYSFVVSAYDDGCPTEGFSARSFQIIVKDKPRFDIKTEIDDCGKGKIIISDTGVVRAAQLIYNINGRIIVRNGSLNDTVEVSGLTTGYHKYTITAIGVNGSNNVIEDSLYSNGNPPFNTGNVSYTICPSDTAFFTGSDYLTWGTSIKWSDNSSVPDSFFSPAKDETIYVYGNNGNCADTLAIDVNVLTFDEKIEAKNRSGDAPLLVGFEITSPHDADSVMIDFGDGTSKMLSTLQFPYIHEYAEKGTFDVTYQLSYQGQTCGTSVVVLNDYINVFPTGIENQPAIDFDIFPNPSNGIFIIKSDLKILEIRAFDVTGKQVKIDLNTQNQCKLMSGSKGVYFIEAEFKNGQVGREKIIIK